MDEPCYLLDLPPELVDYIMDFLHPDYLLPLRRTCKFLETLVTPLGAHHWFGDRSYMLADRESMEALRQLTTRKTIAKAMERIRLTNGAAILSEVPTSPTWDEDEERNSRRERALARVRAEEWEFRKGAAVVCLQAIFEDLISLDSEALPTIVCKSNEVRDTARYGYPVGYKALDALLENEGETTISDYQVDGFAYCTLSEALAGPGYTPSRLEIGGIRSGFPLFHFGSEGFVDSFRALTALTIHVEVDKYTDDEAGDDDRARDMRGFVAALQRAQDLNHLELRISTDRYHRGSHEGLFAAIAAARAKRLIMPKLSSISLDSHTIKLPVLLDFLNSYGSPQLQAVRLWRIRDGDVVHNELEDRIYEAIRYPRDAHVQTTLK